MDDRAPSPTPDRRRAASPTPQKDRRSGQDRRNARRLSLSLDIAVPVTVRCDGAVQRGLCRNISEGGTLVELREAPPIGARVEVTFEGTPKKQSGAPDVVLHGEVRHHLAWQFGSEDAVHGLRGVGIRFTDPADEAPLTSWVFRTGRTIH